MTISITKIKLQDVQSLEIDAHALQKVQTRRLLSLLIKKNLLQQLIDSFTPVRVFSLREKLYFAEHGIILNELAELLPGIVIDAVTLQMKNSTTLHDLRTRIVHQIEIESICALDAKSAYAFANLLIGDKQLLRQCDYVQILRCERSSLSKHKKALSQNTEVHTELEVQSIDTIELLKHVPVRKQQAVTA